MASLKHAIKIGIKAWLEPEETPVQTLETVQPTYERSATILMCTPDISCDHAQRCLESIREHTRNIPYELLVFENGRFGKFQHPREINRALEIAQGDVLVTLDDDVVLTNGWLEALMDLAGEDVGIVGNVHINTRGVLQSSIRHAGAWVGLDGLPHHYMRRLVNPVAVPCVCSACMLINDKSLRFNLTYQKYFQEVELCLDSWERGKKVIVSPHRIYHYGQGAMEQLGLSKEAIKETSAHDRATFIERWIDTGRLKELYGSIRHDIDIPLPS